MTGRQAALYLIATERIDAFRRRGVVPADQFDARTEESDEAASEDDAPCRAVYDD